MPTLVAVKDLGDAVLLCVCLGLGLAAGGDGLDDDLGVAPSGADECGGTVRKVSLGMPREVMAGGHTRCWRRPGCQT